ncbi:MAG: XkdX family protein [Lactobacillaceae bacterium]
MLNIFKNLTTQFYSSGLYNKTIINSFVQIGALTADDYQEITGEKYAAPNA